MLNKKYAKIIAIFLIIVFLFSMLSCNNEANYSDNSRDYQYQLVLKGDAFIDRLICNGDTIIRSPFIIQQTYSLPFKTEMNETVRLQIQTSDDECYEFEIMSNDIRITGDNNVKRCGNSQIIIDLQKL